MSTSELKQTIKEVRGPGETETIENGQRQLSVLQKMQKRFLFILTSKVFRLSPFSVCETRTYSAVIVDSLPMSLLLRLLMQNTLPASLLSFACEYGLSYLTVWNTIVFLKNCRNLIQTCCRFSISNFIFMLKHLKVSWKVCLKVFSIRTLWKAPTTLPHRNTTALEKSCRKREPEVRAKMEIHPCKFLQINSSGLQNNGQPPNWNGFTWLARLGVFLSL